MSTKSYNKDLIHAEKLLKQKKYKQALDFLIPRITLFMESPVFYYYMGLACLHTGEIGDARLYINKCLKLEKNNNDASLIMAASYLKSRKTTEAVEIWLDIIDSEPGNKQARKGLNIVREISDSDELIRFAESSDLKKLLPKWSFNVKKMAIIIILVAVLSGGFVFSIPWLSRIPQFISSSLQKNKRADIPVIDIKEIDKLTSSEGSFLYILTEKEIEESLSLAYDYLNEYKDNKALRELNRIRYSNASPEVKLKADLLASVAELPDIINLHDDFSYNEVSHDPWLYENCAILWKGKISNLSVNTNDITFDFLVGYEEEQILYGIVPVIIDFPIDLDPMKPIELMASVVPGDKGKFSLKTIAVHHIIP